MFDYTLHCESGCNCNVHRYCAGVTRDHYASLTSSGCAVPFVCQFCALKSFQITVQRLQTEVGELNTVLASAKALISQLQANIDGGAAAVASTAAVTKSSNGTKRRPTSGGRRQPTPGSKANRKNEGEPVVQEGEG